MLEKMNVNKEDNFMTEILVSEKSSFKPFLISFLSKINPEFIDKTLNKLKSKCVDKDMKVDENENDKNQDDNKEAESLELNNKESSISNLTNNFYKITKHDEYLLRGLILTSASVNNLDDLCEQIIVLIQYIVKMNNFLPNIRWADIETTVESDFLKIKFH